ncbi:MAG: PEP/pyruvate-binding domain-containing protein [Bdellovibrionota bacterium]
MEDLKFQSMAGNFESIICQLEEAAVLKAIHEVVASYDTPKIGMLPRIKSSSVLVQPYYKQIIGGVAFSHNPVNGRRELIVESSSLGADAVVNGKSEKLVIPNVVSQELKKYMEKIEKILKCPIDVEWGYGDDGIKIFQARPIVFKNKMARMDNKKRLLVIAGGQGNRIKKMFNTSNIPFTKHVLPLPTNGRNVIGAIVDRAKKSFSNVDIIASDSTIPFFTPLFEQENNLKIINDHKMFGPLYYPFIYLIKTKQRVYACCGDIYSDFNWEDMEIFHNKHAGCVTALVSKSFPTQNAACFEIDSDSRIVKYTRRENSEKDLINIGAYIFDWSSSLSEIIKELIINKNCKEDLFFKKCIDYNILYGYTTNELSCNINTPETYNSLIDKLKMANF